MVLVIFLVYCSAKKKKKKSINNNFDKDGSLGHKNKLDGRWLEILTTSQWVGKGLRVR